MKRILFIMILSSFTILHLLALPAAADEILAEAPEEIIPGRLFNTVISIDTEYPLTAIQLEITVSDVLSFRSVKLCQSGNSNFYEDQNDIKMILLADETFISGELAEVTFFAEKTPSAVQSQIRILAADSAGTSFESCPITGKSASIDVNIKTESSSSKNTSTEINSSVSAIKQNQRLTSSLKSNSSKSTSLKSASSKITSSAKKSSKKSSSKEDDSAADDSSENKKYSVSSFSYFKSQTNISPAVYAVSGSVITIFIIGIVGISFKFGQYSVSKRQKSQKSQKSEGFDILKDGTK